MTIKTFPLFGAAYSSSKSLDNCLTHSCEVDDQGFPTRVLCGKVKLANIVDDATMATNDTPTCPRCAAKLKALAKPKLKDRRVVRSDLKTKGVPADLITPAIQALVNDTEMPQKALDALFHHFCFVTNEMPYGTAKARTGDPETWIMNKLGDLYTK